MKTNKKVKLNILKSEKVKKIIGYVLLAVGVVSMFAQIFLICKAITVSETPLWMRIVSAGLPIFWILGPIYGIKLSEG